MKALVIGSEGNIGVPLVKHLKTLGYEVHECDHKPAFRENYTMADVRNATDLMQAFDCKPDVVFHLAAMVSRVTCEQAASLAVDVNLTGTQNVLDLTKRVKAKIVYFSTSEVYGPNIEFMDEDILPKPNNRYGLTKLLSESLVEYEVLHHGLQAVILRPFMMYDEDEDLGDHRSAMIRFATNLALGKPIEVHASSARGWLHVSDAVRAIEAAARVDGYHIINIGNDDIRPIKELAELIRIELKASNHLINEISLPLRMTLEKKPNLMRQKNILGITPLVTFEAGVKKVCSRVTQRLTQSGLLKI